MANNKELLTNLIIPALIVIVVAYLLYVFLKGQGLIKEDVPTSTAVTGECPNGPKYTKMLFGECAPNYVLDPWENFFSGGTCKCLNAK